jgi:hypothetical protein
MSDVHDDDYDDDDVGPYVTKWKNKAWTNITSACNFFLTSLNEHGLRFLYEKVL